MIEFLDTWWPEFLTMLAILFLLVLSGFFSGSETALTAASKSRILSLERRGSSRARMVNRLRKNSDRMLSSILLGNNLVNILASALATSLLLRFFGDAGILLATIVMTLLIVIFSEVMPKSYALLNAERVALLVAPVMRLIVILLYPFTSIVNFIVRVVSAVLLKPKADDEEGAAEDELRGAIELHAANIQEENREARHMLNSILDLDDITVDEIMTHRRSVDMMDIDMPSSEVLTAVLDSSYTRIPVYKGEVENIVGVVHAKALLRAMKENGGDAGKIKLAEIAAEPWFVPETTSLLDQLEAFQNRNEHFSIVVDEYGTIQGIVTLEDILEEIVGEIADEHDTLVEGVVLESDGSVIADGIVTIRDINRQFDWELPDEDAATIAGLVLYEARHIPNKGQVFDFHGFRFEILERQRNQITSLKIKPTTSSSFATNEKI
jgi:Mg2+/Co2+ transporter CorB